MKEPDPDELNTDASLDERIVFKVVDSSQCSCLSLGTYTVHYPVGEFVTAPKGTKFFIFDSRDHADEFKRLEPDLRVWRATVKGVSSADRRVCHPKETVDIEDFWRVHNGGGSYGVLAGRRTPSGTLWADQVRLDACLELGEPPEQDQSVDWTCPDAIKRFVKRWLGMD
jgi:hypothetical protein